MDKSELWPEWLLSRAVRRRQLGKHCRRIKYESRDIFTKRKTV